MEKAKTHNNAWLNDVLKSFVTLLKGNKCRRSPHVAPDSEFIRFHSVFAMIPLLKTQRERLPKVKTLAQVTQLTASRAGI